MTQNQYHNQPHCTMNPTDALPYASALAMSGLSRRLAPEDVQPGQYVSVLLRHEGFWRYDCESDEVIRHRVVELPEADDASQAGGRAGSPMCVLGVSLPFVVVRLIGEGGDWEAARPVVRTLDLRQVELAEVGRNYAMAFAAACRPPPAGEGSSTRRSGRGWARRFGKAWRRE